MKFFHRRQFLHLAAGAVALPAGLRKAWAQAYPSRPITIVVPFAAGGPTDTLARILAERLRESLGQTVVIENTVGAAGSIGVNRVARALPDGYTISIGHLGTHVINGAIYPLQYDVLKDFEPVGLISDYPSLVVLKKCRASKRSAGADRLGKVERRVGWDIWDRRRHARCRNFISQPNWRRASLCAVSRSGTCTTGLGRGTDRPDV
jgi:hypothetical protein